MKLKELEREINNQIEKEKMIEGKFTFDETIQVIKSRVRKVLEDNGFKDEYKDDNIYVESGYGNGSNVVIKSRIRWGKDTGITIKIRRKRLDREYRSFYGYTYYYGIKSIEVEDYFDSIEEWIENEKRLVQEKNDYRKEKMEKFMDKLEEEISFQKFFEIKELWDNVEYSDKIKIAKDYVGEDYYKYI